MQKSQVKHQAKNTNPKELSRIPQNINFNPDALDTLFGSEAYIIRDVLVLASNNYSKDLFGSTTLTIDDFMKLGHKRTDLQRVIPTYAHLSQEDISNLVKERRQQLGIDINSNESDYMIIENMSNNTSSSSHPFIGDHLCITRLDHALYKAFSNSLKITRKKGNSIFTTELKLIEGLQILNVDRVTKRKYVFKLSSSWVNSLFNEYHLIDFNEYLSLTTAKVTKTGSYRNFYLYLGRIISQIQYLKERKQGDKYIISVDDLCQIFGVSFADPKNKKKHIKKALDEIQGMLVQSRYEWQFVSNGGRNKYYIEFTFSEETLSYFDEKLKASLMKTVRDSLKGIYIRSGAKENIFERAAANKFINEDEFYRWMQSDVDQLLKEQTYNQAYNQVYKNIQIGESKVPKEEQKYYITTETLEMLAESNKMGIDDFAKCVGYSKDAKGYYKWQ